MASTSTPAKRLPISCEPCRKRKIKCPRDCRPCQTCVRRGLHPDECIYLGRPRLSSEQALGVTDGGVQQELLDRIRNLEDLLQKQVDSQLQQSKNSPVSPPSTVASSVAKSSAPPSEVAVDSTSVSTAHYYASGNLGFLKVIPSGHVRYIPVATQWNSIFAKAPGSDGLDGLDDDLFDDSEFDMALLGKGEKTRKELIAMLPPGPYCDALTDVYFQVFSPLFHIVHDPTFEDEYRNFRSNPESVSKSWLALLFIVLAIGVSALKEEDPMLLDLGRETTISDNIRVLSARYRSAAIQCLAADSVVSRHSMRSLQALVLLIYARSHAGQPTWTLLGFTHHVAIAMGCHIDPGRFGLSTIECEERRRVWAGLIMQYTIQNTAFGSLDSRFLSNEVILPADVDDRDLLSGAEFDRESRSRPTQMTYLLIKFRLYEISAKICQNIFNMSARPQPSELELDREILAIQEACNERYISDTSKEPLPNHHMANLNIIYSYINQLTLLLYRPLFGRYLQGDLASPGTRNARDRCLEAARGILAVHRNMVEMPQFSDYTWYNSGLGSFHAFHAAITLAAVLIQPDGQAEIEDVKRSLSDSIELFGCLAHRSAICSRVIPIIRSLLTHTRESSTSVDCFNVPHGYMPESSAMDFSMDAFFTQLQPEYWLSPTSAAWDGWDFLSEQQQPFDLSHSVAQSMPVRFHPGA